jgi:hypothetical protein
MIINDLILNYVILFIILELYEVSWQKANTLMGMLARMYQHYHNNIILFLVMQPTFYFSIGFVMLSGYNPYSMLLLFIKTVDVAMKIQLLEQVFVKKELSLEMSEILLAPLHKFMPYIGLSIYPFLIIKAIS